MQDLEVLQLILKDINWINESVNYLVLNNDLPPEEPITEELASSILIDKFLRLEISQEVELYSGGWIEFRFAVRILIQTIGEDCYEKMLKFLYYYFTKEDINRVRGKAPGMYNLDELFSDGRTNIFSYNNDNIITTYEYSIVDEKEPFLEVFASGY